jgi:hypothetical protein
MTNPFITIKRLFEDVMDAPAGAARLLIGHNFMKHDQTRDQRF